MANILVINSSPRTNSNTRVVVARVAAAAKQNGHVIEIIEIGKAKINPCIGCEVCHEKTPGKCVFPDVMSECHAKLASAEIIIFAGPIYYFTMNAQMKAFLDRCYAIGVEPFKGKRVGAIFVYGDVDPVKSGCVNAIRTFQDICAYIPCQWLGAVYGTAWEEGDAEKNEELLRLADEYGAAL